MAGITQEEMRVLLKAQLGELEGVIMYRVLADVVKDPKDRETFLQLAKEEGHHAAVFHKLTGKSVKGRRWKGTMLAVLYRILGRKRLYPLIAKGEYAAEKSYAPVVDRFPEVAGVQADEKRHGDTVMGLLEKESKVKKLIYALLLISLGCFIGIHRRVIKAWLTGSEMPEAPEWHTQFCHGLKRRSE